MALFLASAILLKYITPMSIQDFSLMWRMWPQKTGGRGGGGGGVLRPARHDPETSHLNIAELHTTWTCGQPMSVTSWVVGDLNTNA